MDTSDFASLADSAKDLGFLIGLLKGTKDDLSVNLDWFSDPETGLSDGFNWQHLQPVLESFLGKAANPLNAGDDLLNENWYSITVNNDEGEPGDSGFYFVQKTAGVQELLGVGTHKQFENKAGANTVSIHPFAFIPVFKMPVDPYGTPIFDINTDGPVEIGIEVNYSGTFTLDTTAYNGMIFVASFDFNKNTPDLTFLLREPGGEYQSFPSIDKKVIFNTLLNLESIAGFLGKNVMPDKSPIQFNWGNLFYALKWLETEKAPYTAGTIDITAAPDALKDYIKTLLLNAFNKLTGASNDLVTTLYSKKAEKKGDPSWSIGIVKENGLYGLNVQLNDIKVSSNPLVKLQFGCNTSDGTSWIEKAGGTKPSVPGINFFLLKGTGLSDISFDPQFEALSVGLDISKASGQPLFDIKNYSLKKAELRGYFTTLSGITWGVAAAVNGIALPLGLPSKDGKDSVAKTLLATADKPKKEADAKPAVNPEFSLLTAYLKKFYLQLFDKNGKPQDVVSIPLQKSFGPVALNDVGIGWRGSDYSLLFQLGGGLNLDALKLGLESLTVGVPVKTPADIGSYSLDLEGLDISFSSGSVSIAGGFLKDNTTSPTQYNGMVAIQAAKWGITALGSFATLDGHPSLFIFGVLNAPLGGPPFFFVTGVAVGFGYNRTLVMPDIDQVQNFPFVKAAVEPDLFDGEDAAEVLSSISQYVPPQLGSYWFVAGVKFTSFELLNSFALLMLQFGKTFEVDLLGLTTLQMPKQFEDEALPPYVNAEMAIKATIQPSEGLLAVEAQLTDNSYVIDPKCKVTGGFAYYSWFDGTHSGDFVVTLGGYNQLFDPPDHYPAVPRLAFEWNVSDKINFSGEAYFALTPSCVMAGGKLSLTYEDGDLQAWFKAIADFLISWKPFHYDIGIGITIGVSYRVNLLFIHKTITVELGVNVQMWGPEFGGQATVRLWIISFTVNFGADNEGPSTLIEWEDFEKYFLPNDEESENRKRAGQLFEAANDSGSKEIVKINVNAGLKEKITEGGVEYWIVDPGTFAFNTESAIPASQISFGAAGSNDAPPVIPCKLFGLKPLGSLVLEGNASDLNVQLKKLSANANDKDKEVSLKGWNLKTDPKNVPDALWGTINKGAEAPEANSVSGITSGLSSVTPPSLAVNGPPEFPQKTLAYTPVQQPPHALPLDSDAELKMLDLSASGSLDQIKNTINNPQTGAKQRAGVFGALTQLGSLANTNNDLAATAEAPQNIYQGSPMLADPNARPHALIAKKPLAFRDKNRASLRSAVPAGHVLKTTLLSYRFGESSGQVLRGGNHQTFASKAFYHHNKDANDARMFSILPGMVQIWDINTAANDEQLLFSGLLPVRVIFFDEHLQIISDTVQPPAQNGFTHIPRHATQMCLQAFEPRDTKLCGWHQNAYLPLLNSKYLAGKGCLIRTKTAQRVGFKQYSHDTGLVSLRSVILNNKKLTQGSKKVSGWVETRFAANIKQVFVLARPDWDIVDINNNKHNLEVRLIYTDTNGNTHAQDLSATTTGRNDNELWAGFNIPQIADTDGYFSIWIEAGNELSLAGVAGTEHPLKNWSAALSDELAGIHAGLTAKNMGLKTSLKLKNALNF